MITKIIMDDVASYEEETYLETNKTINLIYGLNGSGKTLFSRYLRNPDDEDFDFKKCRIQEFDKSRHKILVYNEGFVKDIFYNNHKQRGVFSLSKENKEALEKIEKAIKLINPLQDSINHKKVHLQENTKKIAKRESEIRNKIWEINRGDKKLGDNLFDLNDFFKNLGTKDKLFNKLLVTELKEPNKTLEEIKVELQQIGEDATVRAEIPKLLGDRFLEIEENSIFDEPISGSANRPISKIIDRLGNSDWVKQGLDYIDDQNQTCPFCQQNTLKEDLKTEIKDYFDQSYQDKISQIKTLERLYNNLKESIRIEDYKRDYFDISHMNELANLFDNLDLMLQKNLENIRQKVNFPRRKITLENSKDALDKLNVFISERNIESSIFNGKIENRDATIESIKESFWAIQRKEYESWIATYKTDIEELKEQRTNIEEDIISYENKIRDQETVISKNQRDTVNIEQTIDNINRHLLDFGINYFKIVKYDENHYRIQREHEKRDIPVFKSLSEGEKTVISFLYFVELCMGKETVDETKQKIIVIDDPISSLSQTYVFNIAQLIKKLFKNIGQNDFIQFFVLTHSLYFFHELADMRRSRKRKLKEIFSNHKERY